MLYPEEKGQESRYKAAARRKNASLIPVDKNYYPTGTGRKLGDPAYKKFLVEWLLKTRGKEA